MDSLSRGINTMKGIITICKISRNYEVSHLLFINDVLCAGATEITEWEYFHHMSDIFGKESTLIISSSKTKLINYDHGSEVHHGIS